MTPFLLVAGATMLIALPLLTRPLWSTRSGHGAKSKRIQAELNRLTRELAKGAIDEDRFKLRQSELTQALTGELAAETEPPAPRNKLATVSLLLGIPLLVAAIYGQIGKPGALGGVEPVAQATGQPMDMNAAIASLRSRLEADPNDAEGWALLGRSYMAIQNYSAANEALERAAALTPNDPNVQVALAESLIFVSGQSTLPGRSEQLLLQALAVDPNNQKGLWLMGLGAYQAQQWPQAVSYWDRLMAMLQPTDGAAEQISGMLADARQKAGLAEPVATQETASGPTLTIHVSLDPMLQSSVTGHETLFVFARAPSGPPMPLAIQRLRAADLPLAVVLDDTHAMVANMNLSSREDVVVGARISRTGNAAASPGDIQAFTDPVSTGTQTPIPLVINHVVE